VVYLTGVVASNNLPLSANAAQRVIGEGVDSFVAAIDVTKPDKEAILYASYFGGPGNEFGTRVRLRPDGKIVITGYTTSGELPGTDSRTFQAANRGGIDSYFAEFDPAGTESASRTYTTYYGGNGTDVATGLAVLPSGEIVLSGFTSSNDIPDASIPYRNTPAGRGDGFLAILDFRKPSLDAIQYATYFGGADLDYPQALHIDADGAAWLTGYTLSRDFPVIGNAIQSSISGSVDAFLVRLDWRVLGESGLRYSSYFGGNGADVAYAITADGPSRFVLGGYTTSSAFPTRGDVLPARNSGPSPDAFLASVNPETGAVEWAGTLGDALTDTIVSVARDAAGNIAFGGYTNSVNVQVRNGRAKSNPVGQTAGFIGRIVP
jgi:hypothetical protein